MQFRKSKSFGGLRLTASKKGLGVSVGAGPFRISLGADGKMRRTVRVPGTGVYDTKVIGKTQRAWKPASHKPEPEVGEVTFEGDDSPKATSWQRNYIRLMLRGKVAEMPDLSELTIGQAEQILEAVGVNPKGLYRAGRSNKQQRAWREQRDLK